MPAYEGRHTISQLIQPECCVFSWQLQGSVSEGQRTPSTGLRGCSQQNSCTKGQYTQPCTAVTSVTQCRVPITWPALKNSKHDWLKVPAFETAGTSDLACQVCMLVKSRLDQDIGDKSDVGELVPSDWGQAAALQPVLNGGLLIGVPICSNHWLHHHHLSHYKAIFHT